MSLFFIYLFNLFLINSCYKNSASMVELKGSITLVKKKKEVYLLVLLIIIIMTRSFLSLLANESHIDFLAFFV